MVEIKFGDQISIGFGIFGSKLHKGVCIGFHPSSGEPIIAHNSARFGCARKDTLSVFCDGKPYRIQSRNTKRSHEQIRSAVDKQIGKPYHWQTNNCEHFVSEALGLNEGSPQLVFWSFVGLAGLAYWATRSRSG